MGALRDAMINEMKLFGYSPKTIKMYVKYMARFAEYLGRSPLDVTPEELKSFFLDLIARDASPTTIHLFYSSLKLFYRFHGLDQLLDRIPPPKRPFRIPAVMDQSEIQAILDACANLRYRTLFALIYSAGLRVSEAAALKCSDIDFSRRVIHVRCSKNRQDRYTILSEKTAGLIKKYLERYMPKDYLFYSLRCVDRPMPIRRIQAIFHGLVLKTGVKDAHVHTLRHSFATHLVESDTNLFHIMKLLGHSSLSSTLVYLHMRRLDTLHIVSPLDSSSISVDRDLGCEGGQYLLPLAS